MPRLNLRDNSADPQPDQPEHSGQEMSQPNLNEYDDGAGRKTPWIVLLAVIVLIGVVLTALNQFHVIHLWGKKTPRVVEAMQEPGTAPADTTTMAAQQPGGESAPSVAEPTPLPMEPAPAEKNTRSATRRGTAAERGTSAERKAAAPSDRSQSQQSTTSSSGAPAAGRFAVQVSSWPTRGRADRLAAQLSAAGFTSYVVEGDVNGKTWYRVRVGKYASSGDAAAAVSELQQKGYEGAMVVK